MWQNVVPKKNRLKIAILLAFLPTIAGTLELLAICRVCGRLAINAKRRARDKTRAQKCKMDRVLTIDEAAALLGRSKRNVLSLQERGLLPRVIPPGGKRGKGVPASAVDEFIRRCTTTPEPRTGKAVARD